MLTKFGGYGQSAPNTPDEKHREQKKRDDMIREELRKSIERLRSEIDAVEKDDVGTKEHLQSLVTDLEKQVDNIAGEDHRDSLLDRLSEAIEAFETSHPHLTDALNKIVVTLGNMGI